VGLATGQLERPVRPAARLTTFDYRRPAAGSRRTLGSPRIASISTRVELLVLLLPAALLGVLAIWSR
jgi:hypothetical protein